MSRIQLWKELRTLTIIQQVLKKDSLNESFVFHLLNGTWSTHYNDCSREAMIARYSKRGDKHACQKCFDFPYIQFVKDRVKRRERIYDIEQYITEIGRASCRERVC